jgi:hypothetical protein
MEDLRIYVADFAPEALANGVVSVGQMRIQALMAATQHDIHGRSEFIDIVFGVDFQNRPMQDLSRFVLWFGQGEDGDNIPHVVLRVDLMKEHEVDSDRVHAFVRRVIRAAGWHILVVC